MHIAVVGENGYARDAEGLTVYYARDGGYLIASCQGNDRFIVYGRLPPHEFVKSFHIEDVKETDEIDVANVNLGPGSPYGLLVCHADGNPSIAVVVAYEDLELELEIDTSYDPRTVAYETE